MKASKAIKLAIDALDDQQKRFAVDAFWHDTGIADYPYSQTASEKRQEINEAIAALVELGKALKG